MTGVYPRKREGRRAPARTAEPLPVGRHRSCPPLHPELRRTSVTAAARSATLQPAKARGNHCTASNRRLVSSPQIVVNVLPGGKGKAFCPHTGQVSLRHARSPLTAEISGDASHSTAAGIEVPFTATAAAIPGAAGGHTSAGATSPTESCAHCSAASKKVGYPCRRHCPLVSVSIVGSLFLCCPSKTNGCHGLCTRVDSNTCFAVAEAATLAQGGSGCTESTCCSCSEDSADSGRLICIKSPCLVQRKQQSGQRGSRTACRRVSSFPIKTDGPSAPHLRRFSTPELVRFRAPVIDQPDFRCVTADSGLHSGIDSQISYPRSRSWPRKQARPDSSACDCKLLSEASENECGLLLEPLPCVRGDVRVQCGAVAQQTPTEAGAKQNVVAPGTSEQNHHSEPLAGQSTHGDQCGEGLCFLEETSQRANTSACPSLTLPLLNRRRLSNDKGLPIGGNLAEAAGSATSSQGVLPFEVVGEQSGSTRTLYRRDGSTGHLRLRRRGGPLGSDAHDLIGRSESAPAKKTGYGPQLRPAARCFPTSSQAHGPQCAPSYGNTAKGAVLINSFLGPDFSMKQCCLPTKSATFPGRIRTTCDFPGSSKNNAEERTQSPLSANARLTPNFPSSACGAHQAFHVAVEPCKRCFYQTVCRIHQTRCDQARRHCQQEEARRSPKEYREKRSQLAPNAPCRLPADPRSPAPVLKGLISAALPQALAVGLGKRTTTLTPELASQVDSRNSNHRETEATFQAAKRKADDLCTSVHTVNHKEQDCHNSQMKALKSSYWDSEHQHAVPSTDVVSDLGHNITPTYRHTLHERETAQPRAFTPCAVETHQSRPLTSSRSAPLPFSGPVLQDTFQRLVHSAQPQLPVTRRQYSHPSLSGNQSRFPPTLNRLGGVTSVSCNMQVERYTDRLSYDSSGRERQTSRTSTSFPASAGCSVQPVLLPTCSLAKSTSSNQLSSSAANSVPVTPPSLLPSPASCPVGSRLQRETVLIPSHLKKPQLRVPYVAPPPAATSASVVCLQSGTSTASKVQRIRQECVSGPGSLSHLGGYLQKDKLQTSPQGDLNSFAVTADPARSAPSSRNPHPAEYTYELLGKDLHQRIQNSPEEQGCETQRLRGPPHLDSSYPVPAEICVDSVTQTVPTLLAPDGGSQFCGALQRADCAEREDANLVEELQSARSNADSSNESSHAIDVTFAGLPEAVSQEKSVTEAQTEKPARSMPFRPDLSLKHQLPHAAAHDPRGSLQSRTTTAQSHSENSVKPTTCSPRKRVVPSVGRDRLGDQSPVSSPRVVKQVLTSEKSFSTDDGKKTTAVSVSFAPSRSLSLPVISKGVSSPMPPASYLSRSATHGRRGFAGTTADAIRDGGAITPSAASLKHSELGASASGDHHSALAVRKTNPTKPDTTHSTTPDSFERPSDCSPALRRTATKRTSAQRLPPTDLFTPALRTHCPCSTLHAVNRGESAQIEAGTEGAPLCSVYVPNARPTEMYDSAETPKGYGTSLVGEAPASSAIPSRTKLEESPGFSPPSVSSAPLLRGSQIERVVRSIPQRPRTPSSRHVADNFECCTSNSSSTPPRRPQATVNDALNHDQTPRQHTHSPTSYSNTFHQTHFASSLRPPTTTDNVHEYASPIPPSPSPASIAASGLHEERVPSVSKLQHSRSPHAHNLPDNFESLPSSVASTPASKLDSVTAYNTRQPTSERQLPHVSPKRRCRCLSESLPKVVPSASSTTLHQSVNNPQARMHWTSRHLSQTPGGLRLSTSSAKGSESPETPVRRSTWPVPQLQPSLALAPESCSDAWESLTSKAKPSSASLSSPLANGSFGSPVSHQTSMQSCSTQGLPIANVAVPTDEPSAPDLLLRGAADKMMPTTRAARPAECPPSSFPRRRTHEAGPGGSVANSTPQLKPYTTLCGNYSLDASETSSRVKSSTDNCVSESLSSSKSPAALPPSAARKGLRLTIPHPEDIPSVSPQSCPNIAVYSGVSLLSPIQSSQSHTAEEQDEWPTAPNRQRKLLTPLPGATALTRQPQSVTSAFASDPVNTSLPACRTTSTLPQDRQSLSAQSSLQSIKDSLVYTNSRLQTRPGTPVESNHSSVTIPPQRARSTPVQRWVPVSPAASSASQSCTPADAPPPSEASSAIQISPTLRAHSSSNSSPATQSYGTVPTQSSSDAPSAVHSYTSVSAPSSSAFGSSSAANSYGSDSAHSSSGEPSLTQMYATLPEPLSSDGSPACLPSESVPRNSQHSTSSKPPHMHGTTLQAVEDSFRSLSPVAISSPQSGLPKVTDNKSTASPHAFNLNLIGARGGFAPADSTITFSVDTDNQSSLCAPAQSGGLASDSAVSREALAISASSQEFSCSVDSRSLQSNSEKRSMSSTEPTGRHGDNGTKRPQEAAFKATFSPGPVPSGSSPSRETKSCLPQMLGQETRRHASSHMWRQASHDLPVLLESEKSTPPAPDLTYTRTVEGVPKPQPSLYSDMRTGAPSASVFMRAKTAIAPRVSEAPPRRSPLSCPNAFYLKQSSHITDKHDEGPSQPVSTPSMTRESPIEPRPSEVGSAAQTNTGQEPFHAILYTPGSCVQETPPGHTPMDAISPFNASVVLRQHASPLRASACSPSQGAAAVVSRSPDLRSTSAGLATPASCSKMKRESLRLLAGTRYGTSTHRRDDHGSTSFSTRQQLKTYEGSPPTGLQDDVAGDITAQKADESSYLVRPLAQDAGLSRLSPYSSCYESPAFPSAQSGPKALLADTSYSSLAHMASAAADAVAATAASTLCHSPAAAAAAAVAAAAAAVTASPVPSQGMQNGCLGAATSTTLSQARGSPACDALLTHGTPGNSMLSPSAGLGKLHASVSAEHLPGDRLLRSPAAISLQKEDFASPSAARVVPADRIVAAHAPDAAEESYARGLTSNAIFDIPHPVSICNQVRTPQAVRSSELVGSRAAAVAAAQERARNAAATAARAADLAAAAAAACPFKSPRSAADHRRAAAAAASASAAAKRCASASPRIAAASARTAAAAASIAATTAAAASARNHDGYRRAVAVAAASAAVAESARRRSSLSKTGQRHQQSEADPSVWGPSLDASAVLPRSSDEHCTVLENPVSRLGAPPQRAKRSIAAAAAAVGLAAVRGARSSIQPAPSTPFHQRNTTAITGMPVQVLNASGDPADETEKNAATEPVTPTAPHPDQLDSSWLPTHLLKPPSHPRWQSNFAGSETAKIPSGAHSRPNIGHERQATAEGSFEHYGKELGTRHSQSGRTRGRASPHSIWENCSMNWSVVVNEIKCSSGQCSSTPQNGSTDPTGKKVSFLQQSDVRPRPLLTWELCQELMMKKMRESASYSLDGVPYEQWSLHTVPTMGASVTPTRCQRMRKGRLRSGRGVFIKKVPSSVWRQQWLSAQRFKGFFLTDGENFVGEAALSAFLTEVGPACAAPLLAIVRELRTDRVRKLATGESSNHWTGDNGSPHHTAGSHEQYVLVYEVFGQGDLVDFFKSTPSWVFSPMLKRRLQYAVASLLLALHTAGIAHLDLTPENILVHAYQEPPPCYATTRSPCKPQGNLGASLSWRGAQQNAALPSHDESNFSTSKSLQRVDLRVCDLAKAVWLDNTSPFSLPDAIVQAHMPHNESSIVAVAQPPSLSCEPTVAKGPYMPPECWEIVYRLRMLGVTAPFKQIGKPLLTTGRAPPPLFLRETHTTAPGENDSRMSHAYRKQSSTATGRGRGLDVANLFFDVRKADIYMLGVLLFWIWAQGSVWYSSDPLQDAQYNLLVQSGLDFSKFPDCEGWPTVLLDLLKVALQPDPRKRGTLEDVLRHPWWTCNLERSGAAQQE